MSEKNWEKIFQHSKGFVLTEEQFSALVEEYLETMRRRVRYLLYKSHLPQCDAEDLIGKTLISAYNAIFTNKNFRFDNLKGYLVRSAVNKTLNYIRQFNNHNYLPFEELEEKHPSDRAIDHSVTVEFKLMCEQIIRQLSEEEKIIWKLLLMGCDSADIAIVLGISKGAVYVKVHRFKGKMAHLKKKLDW